MILVTGASGFVGMHLVRFLSEAGNKVRALYNRNAPGAEALALRGVEWVQCDLLDIFAVAEAMQDITHVYHCAAWVSFHAADKYEMQRVNQESTAHLVDACLDAGVQKLLFVSSIAALGRSQQGKPISEESQWEESKNNTSYARSKYLAEMEVWRGVAEGLNAVVVNPAIILGAGNWDEGSARLMKVVAKEFPFYTEGINGWVDVRDLVKVMVTLMESAITEERFIVCAGSYSYRDIFTQMAEALGKKPPHIKASPFMTGLLWRWNELRHRLAGVRVTVTRETARTAQSVCYYDNAKLLQVLPGFSYRPIADTIRDMAAAYQADQ
jgi:nucleoside-diphosphate-sugar epimerase